MYEQDRAHYLMEYILKLQDHLRENGMELDQLSQEGGMEAFLAMPDAGRFLTACEIVRFMDEMPGGFLIYCAGGEEEIIYANRAALRIFCCDTMAQFRELTGNSFRGMVHPEDLEAVEASIHSQINDSQNDLDYVEYRIIRRDGVVRWIEDYGRYVRGGAFRDVFYVFLGDATEKHSRLLAEWDSLLDGKRRGEEQLQAMVEERTVLDQEHLRRLEVIEGLGVNYESIFYADLEKDQVLPYRLSSRSGPIFRECLKTRRLSEVLSDYLNAWVHPEDRALFAQATQLEHLRQRLAEEQVFNVSYRVLNGDETQYLQMRVVDVKRQGQAGQVVMGFRRVDQELQHELEQKQMLAQALESARQAISAKDIFLSNMSHDMRTPLNAIFGFTTLAKQNSGDPEAVRRYLGRIETTARQLLDLINKVLEFSQTESGGGQVAEEECDIIEIVGETYEFLRPQAIEKDIDFTMNCTGVVHRAILGDREKLGQLLMYLVNNALTYTNPGGRVTITAQELEERPGRCALYRLTVEDTGIGVSEEFLKRIFEPFARERNTTLSGIHGIGLGLTIAKNIVELMDGTIDVKSEVGKGSTFAATLRFHLQPQEEQPGKPELAPQTDRKSILLVEDNEINREIETEILQELGFAVDTAEDGSAGVEKLKQAGAGRYDLVLMDIQMPVMDGWQAARAIRALPDPALARIPIIALSANVFESDMRRSEESGMNAHLPKPLDVSQLLETIEALSGGQARENQN